MGDAAETFAAPDDVRRSWDVVAATYADTFFDELDHKPFDREFLERFAAVVAGRGTVVEVGCGPGHIGRYLAEHGLDMMGIDVSPGMIAVARERNPHLSFAVGDMTALAVPDDTFAGIAAFYALVNFERSRVPAVFAEFARVLRPGGSLAVAVHGGEGAIHRDEWHGLPVRLSFTMFSLDHLVAAAKAEGFVIDEATTRAAYPDEHPTDRLYVRATLATQGDG